MKKFLSITVGVILVFMIVFILIAQNIQDNGLDTILNYDDFIEYSKNLKTNIYAMEAEELIDYEETAFDFLESQTGETCIFVVKADIGFRIKSGCFFQNAVIEKVIQGDSKLCQKEIWLARDRGIVIYKDMVDTAYVNTLPAVNVMNPGERYLVFCEEGEISYALSVPMYRVALSPYALLNIDRDDKCAISDCQLETFINDGCKYEELVAPYGNWINQEFMGNSDETLEVFLSVKSKILTKYGLR